MKSNFGSKKKECRRENTRKKGHIPFAEDIASNLFAIGVGVWVTIEPETKINKTVRKKRKKSDVRSRKGLTCECRTILSGPPIHRAPRADTGSPYPCCPVAVLPSPRSLVSTSPGRQRAKFVIKIPRRRLCCRYWWHWRYPGKQARKHGEGN